jgi:hypothetical protein
MGNTLDGFSESLKKEQKSGSVEFLYPPFKFTLLQDWRGDLAPHTPGSKHQFAIIGPRDLSKIDDWVLSIFGEKLPQPLTDDLLKSVLKKHAIDISLFNKAADPNETTISDWVGFELRFQAESAGYYLLSLKKNEYWLMTVLSIKDASYKTPPYLRMVDNVKSIIGSTSILE